MVGRFAPSPSGRIHLGNILCCLLAWLSARQQGGQVVLRIEDLDTARCPRRYADRMEADLRWLGLEWDRGPTVGGPYGPYYQSERTALYQAALQKLEEKGLVYRTVSATDGRCRILALTEEGQRFHDDFQTVLHQVNERLERGFTQEEKAQFTAFLLRAGRNLTDEEEEA